MDDVWDISDHLRLADETEILLRGRHPIEGLKESFSASRECYVLVEGESVIAIGGVTEPTDTAPASPWMMCSYRCRLRHFIALRKWGLHFLTVWNAKYGALYNAPWAGNEAHIRWCRSVGFKAAEPVVSGAALYVPILFDYV